MDRKWNSSRKMTSKEDNPNIIEERVIVKSKTDVGGNVVSSPSDSKSSFRTLYSKGKQIGKGGFAK